MMVSISFDPGLEGEQQNSEQMKQRVYYRLSHNVIGGTQNKSVSYLKILAVIGDRLAMLGTTLQERYGEPVDSSREDSQTDVRGR